MKIKIEGLTELAGQLEKLKTIPQGVALRQALLEGAELIARQARANAPIAPPGSEGRGFLRRSIRASSGREFKNFIQSFAYTFKTAAFYAHMVEFGTKPHIIAAKAKKKMLKFGRAFTAFAKKVQHPGSRPIPFFRDAIRTQRGAVKRLLEAKVKAAFEALGRAA